MMNPAGWTALSAASNLVNASGRLAARIGHKLQYSLFTVIVGMAPENTTGGRIRINQKRNKCTSVTETEIRHAEPAIGGTTFRRP